MCTTGNVDKALSCALRDREPEIQAAAGNAQRARGLKQTQALSLLQRGWLTNASSKSGTITSPNLFRKRQRKEDLVLASGPASLRKKGGGRTRSRNLLAQGRTSPCNNCPPVKAPPRPELLGNQTSGNIRGAQQPPADSGADAQTGPSPNIQQWAWSPNPGAKSATRLIAGGLDPS